MSPLVKAIRDRRLTVSPKTEIVSSCPGVKQLGYKLLELEGMPLDTGKDTQQDIGVERGVGRCMKVLGVRKAKASVLAKRVLVFLKYTPRASLLF